MKQIITNTSLNVLAILMLFSTHTYASSSAENELRKSQIHWANVPDDYMQFDAEEEQTTLTDVVKDMRSGFVFTETGKRKLLMREIEREGKKRAKIMRRNFFEKTHQEAVNFIPEYMLAIIPPAVINGIGFSKKDFPMATAQKYMRLAMDINFAQAKNIETHNSWELLKNKMISECYERAGQRFMAAAKMPEYLITRMENENLKLKEILRKRPAARENMKKVILNLPLVTKVLKTEVSPDDYGILVNPFLISDIAYCMRKVVEEAPELMQLEGDYPLLSSILTMAPKDIAYAVPMNADITDMRVSALQVFRWAAHHTNEQRRFKMLNKIADRLYKSLSGLSDGHPLYKKFQTLT
ncbi:MAG: hypothetical protein ACPGXY_03935 [Alphaproteobacteria bacterium]